MPLARATYSGLGGSSEGGWTLAPATPLSTESRSRNGGGSAARRGSHPRSTCARDSEEGPVPLKPRRAGAEVTRQRRSGWVSHRDASSGAACHMHLLRCGGPGSRSCSQPNRSPSRSSGWAAHLRRTRRGGGVSRGASPAPAGPQRAPFGRGGRRKPPQTHPTPSKAIHSSERSVWRQAGLPLTSRDSSW